MLKAATKRVQESIPQATRNKIKVARAHAFERFGSERFSYPALFDLDRKMLPRLPTAGVFLEIGANDGFNQSNTYYLEARQGWRGILIEPLPQMFAMCQRLRHESECFNVACTDDPGITSLRLDDTDLTTVTLDVVQDGKRPTSGRIIEARAMTLSAVIDKSSFDHIDFMSIDVEGAELSVIGGLDLDRHMPSFMLVETAAPEKVDELLGDRMRRVDQLSYHDYLWARE